MIQKNRVGLLIELIVTFERYPFQNNHSLEEGFAKPSGSNFKYGFFHMNLYSMLDKSAILANLSVDNKDDLLNKMIDVLKKQVNDEQLEEIRESVFEREKIMSTGVGKSLAIPHGKVASVDETYAGFAILKDPIEFNSIDKRPVKMAFLLVGPQEKNSTHIKLLSRISRLMNSTSFRETLSRCKTADEIYEAFYQEEVRYFGN